MSLFNVFDSKSKFNAVYKYRGAGDSFLKQDLPTLAANYFWAANFISLNDPCETTYTDKEYLDVLDRFGLVRGVPKKELELVRSSVKNLDNARSTVGIFSLSKTPLDELLWAHYADSHRGYCVEYDLDLLKDENFIVAESFDVVYGRTPPTLKNAMLKNHSDELELIRCVAGHKSERWQYENETRIITDTQGAIHHNFKAIKSIYFGLRMSDTDQDAIMKCLAGRSISYYKMHLLPRTYILRPEPIIDTYSTTPPFYSCIQSYDPLKELIDFEIEEYNISLPLKKATLKIELQKEVDEKVIAAIAIKLRDALFKNVPRSYIFFYVKGIKREYAWATAHHKENKTEVQIGVGSILKF